MRKVRYVIPGQIVSLVRRTTGRQAFLQPTPVIRELFEYFLGYLQTKMGMKILAYAMMPTHYHLTVEDVHGLLPDFMREFDSLLARALNAEYGRKKAQLWSPERTKWTVQLTPEALAENVIYTMMNPTEAGLVPHPRDWRGAISRPDMLGKSRVIKRPNVRFFGKRSVLPAEVTLRLDVPTSEVEAGRGERWAKGIVKLFNEEHRARNAYAKSNKYIGVAGVLKRGVAWKAESEESRRGPTPTAKVGKAEGGAELLKAYLEAQALFQAAHRKAAKELREKGEATFPMGTWKWPRVTARARLASA